MKFALIYRRPFHRTRSKIIDSESKDVITTDLDPTSVFVEHLVDFENQEVIPVVLMGDGKLMRVPDGDFGELTPADFFENQTGLMDL
jgi:hypothetical protein